jgi:hypothetical protein
MKKSIKKSQYMLAGMVAATVFSSQMTAFATYAAAIEQQAPNTTAVLDDNPVISAVLSAPGSVDNLTYKNWSYLAGDSTGSVDVFYSSTVAGIGSYTPTAGDTITVSGNWSPFDGIPEIANSTANPLSISKISSGPAPGAITTTIPAINNGALSANGVFLSNPSGLPTLGGQYLQLNDVTFASTGLLPGTIAGGGNFPTYSGTGSTGAANASYTITDGANSMILFFWASSYSTDGAMAGSAIPTGPVNMDGFVDYFAASSEAEFVATSITPVVPEPSVLNLFSVGGAGSVVAWALRRKKA